VAKPAEIALKVRTATQAQDYRRRWTEQLEDPDAQGNVRDLEDGLEILQRRFGNQLPANPLATGLRRELGDRRRSQPKLADEPEHEPPAPKRRAGSRSNGRRRASRGDRSRSAGTFGAGFALGRYSAPRLAGETGLPDVAWSTTQLVMYAIGGVIGLSLLYLILTNSEGRGHFPVLTTLLGGIEGGITRVIAPVDPIRSSTTAATAPAAVATQGLTAAAGVIRPPAKPGLVTKRQAPLAHR